MIRMMAQSINRKAATKVVGFATLTTSVAVLIGLLLLNPIWERLSPPFPILRVVPPITAPVDGPYYLQNAIKGYRWGSDQPLSIWYHPLLPALISVLPRSLPSHIWFWLLSVGFSIGCLILAYEIAVIFSEDAQIPPTFLLGVVIIPGGLGISTGNPEIPTLFFSSLVLLSVVKWHRWEVTVPASVFAILTKPNALYLIPMLCVYAIWGYRSNSKTTSLHAVAAFLLIAAGWLAWMVFVDWKSAAWGTYWHARLEFSNYVAGNPLDYFLELARSWTNGVSLRDKFRYSTALLIPLVNLWIIALAPFSKNVHRYALAVGNLAMLILVLWQGNPNKVIVYSTTIPGYFSIFMISMMTLLRAKRPLSTQYLSISGSLFLYLVLMVLFYVFGTPLGWYY